MKTFYIYHSIYMNSRTLELNPDKNLDTKNNILYNYYPTSIHSNPYEKTPSSGGYIKLPISYDSKTPNLFSNMFDSPYVCTAVYITKKLHSIPNVRFDGELVLEHSPLTNGFKKIYLCIPLKTKDMNTNTTINKSSIDTIISNSLTTNKKTDADPPVVFTLNDFLEQGQRAIVYDSKGYLWNQTVILFTNPILVGSSFTDFVTDPGLFHSLTDDYQVLVSKRKNDSLTNDINNNNNNKNEKIEGFSNLFSGKIVEGLTKTAYCQPIDDIDPSVSQTANLEIPLTGQYSPNDATNNMVRIVLNFVSFLTLMIATFFGVPIIYDLFVIKLVLSNAGFTGQEKLNRLFSADFYTSAIFISFVFVLITGGISTNNTPQVVMGFFMFMFFVVAFMRIQLLKQDTDTFLLPFGGNTFFSSAKMDLGSFFIENIKYVMDFSSIVFLLVIFCILIALAFTMKLITLPASTAKAITGKGDVGNVDTKETMNSLKGQSTPALYVLALSLYLTILIKYFIGTSKTVTPVASVASAK